tara:strand:- start:21 stop:251 length:231 start_codon:yes stop_codon:yes gene_type:complete
MWFLSRKSTAQEPHNQKFTMHFETTDLQKFKQWLEWNLPSDPQQQKELELYIEDFAKVFTQVDKVKLYNDYKNNKK